jgi:transcriptional regulator with XRE-family HTH domain
MAKPSLQIAPQELQLVREALVKQGMTQKTLAEKLGLHRSVIGAFLQGKPVLLENFLRITEVLGFDRHWEKLGVFSKTTNQDLTELSHENNLDTTPLVQEIRSKIKAHYPRMVRYNACFRYGTTH